MGSISAICDAHKKKVGVELLYNSVHRKFNQLETRCGRESQHTAEGALRPPINQFGDLTSWREDTGMRTCPREAGRPGPRLSSPGERERNAVMANRVGVNMLQFCSVSNSLSHTTLSIKWEVYFSKRLCRSSFLCRRYYCGVMNLHMSVQHFSECAQCPYRRNWCSLIFSLTHGRIPDKHLFVMCCYHFILRTSWASLWNKYEDSFSFVSSLSKYCWAFQWNSIAQIRTSVGLSIYE